MRGGSRCASRPTLVQTPPSIRRSFSSLTTGTDSWAGSRPRGSTPMGSPVCGTYQIQRAGGRGTLASGPNHKGNSDWSQVELVFQAPADGRVRVAPFLVGFGKGRGTAWFDDMAIDRVDPSQAPVVVTRAFLTSARINPFQYGQFIEYLCNLVPGMWAEKLYDGSFEGLSPYKFAYVKETDFREKPWYPIGATNRALHDRDRSNPISGAVCLKIAASEAVPSTGGVAQDGDRGGAGTGLRIPMLFEANRAEGPCERALTTRRDRARLGRAHTDQ